MPTWPSDDSNHAWAKRLAIATPDPATITANATGVARLPGLGSAAISFRAVAHAATQFEIKRNSDDVVVYDSGSLTGAIVSHTPAGGSELAWNTAHSFRVRHQLDDVAATWSPWSSWRSFTTRWRPNATDLSSLTGHWILDAAVAGALATWPDNTGNWNATQATGSRQPIVTENSLNGFPTVKFDGSDDRMITGLTTQFDAACTYFAVINLNGGLADLNRGRILASASGGVGFSVSGTGDNDRKLRSIHNAVAWMPASTGVVPATGWHIVAMTWNATSDEVVYHIDGQQDSLVIYSTGTPSSGANVMWLGAEGDAGTYSSDMAFAEIIACNANVSPDDMAKVTGYLAHKFNLQANLPVGHTYKTVAP